MSSSNSEASVTKPVQNLFQAKVASSSSSEPPREEWLSLISLPPDDSPKRAKYREGLNDPGSGEICTKYVTMSASSILRHPYYAYPGIKDPGIRQALLLPEEKKIYPLDGQELYLDLCEEMKVIPVRSFFRGLREETIDLRYYGVNPVGVRAMSMALNYNLHVRRLDLTSNFLNEDACYHLGQMLRENITLQELVLHGCRVKAQGIRRLVVNLATRSLNLLDLSRNQIEDEGFEYLATQLTKGAVIKRLNLSYNELTSASAGLFAVALENNNSVTHLDLSWNKMSALKGVNDFLSQLSDSKVLVEFNMSWNALTISKVLRKLLSVTTLQILDLSNNRITQPGVEAIAKGLATAKGLHTLDLSYNPLTSQDAFLLVSKLKARSVKLLNLLMDNVEVDKKFMKERNGILSLSYRKRCTITHGFVVNNYELSTPDMREIVFKRLDYIASKGSKRPRLDIGVYFLEMKKTLDNMQPRDITRDLKLAGIYVDDDLLGAVCDMFPGPKLDKSGKTVDLAGITDMVKRLWPDRKPPETLPEPVQEPEQETNKKEDKKEDKKENKKDEKKEVKKAKKK